MTADQKEAQLIRQWLDDTQHESVQIVSPILITGDDWRFDIEYAYRIFNVVIGATHGTYRTSIRHVDKQWKPGEPLFWNCGQGIMVFPEDDHEKSFKRAFDVFVIKVYTYDLWHKERFCTRKELDGVIQLRGTYPNSTLDYILKRAGVNK